MDCRCDTATGEKHGPAHVGSSAHYQPPHHSLTIDHNCSHGVKGGIDEADSIDLTRPGLTRVGKMSAATFDMNDWPKLGGGKRGVSDRMWVKLLETEAELANARHMHHADVESRGALASLASWRASTLTATALTPTRPIAVAV